MTNPVRQIWSLVLCFCIGNSPILAQTVATTWHKRVYRVIDLEPKKNSPPDQRTDKIRDTTLVELINNALSDEKLSAYNIDDNGLTIRLTKSQIYGGRGLCRIDTTTIVNPESGKEEKVQRHDEYCFSAIHKYRVLEDWMCDKESRSTKIQVVAIAPIKDIYQSDFVEAGDRSLFWIKYNEARDIIAHYVTFTPPKPLPA